MKPDDRLIFLLGQARHHIYTSLDQALLGRAGITTAQAGAIFCLMKNDGCLLSQLSQWLMLDKSAITGMVDRLEKKKMVERRNDSSDRRVIRIHLTEAGRAASAQALTVVRKYNKAVKEGFSTKEIETFGRVLQTIVRQYGGKAEND